MSRQAKLGPPPSQGIVIPNPLPVEIVKKSFIVTNAPLAANQVFTSQWYDTTLDGTCFVQITIKANVGGLSVYIYETDDLSEGFSFPLVGDYANNLYRLMTNVRARYWQVVYTNGGAAQTLFELTATTCNIPLDVTEGSAPQYGMSATRVIMSQVGAFPGFGVPALLSGQFIDGQSTGSPEALTDLNSQTSHPLATANAIATGLPQNGTTMWVERAPNVFNTIEAIASGLTTIWTPATGQDFRLLKLHVQVTGNSTLASAGILTMTFYDGPNPTPIALDVYLPSGTPGMGAGNAMDTTIDLGKYGIPSVKEGNPLQINLSSALVTGKVRVNSMGTEERLN